MVSQIQNTHLKNKQQQQEEKCIKLTADSICFHEARFLNRHFDILEVKLDFSSLLIFLVLEKTLFQI